MTHPKASLIIAIDPYSGEVLATTRRGTTDDWGLIGGKAEYGELPVTTAVREFKEETGIDITPPQLICSKLDESGYICDVFLVTNRCDSYVISDNLATGTKEVEPGIIVGFVPWAYLLKGSFGNFNQEILDSLHKHLFTRRSNSCPQ